MASAPNGWNRQGKWNRRLVPTIHAKCLGCDRLFTVLSGQLLLHSCPKTGTLRSVSNVP